MVKKTLLASSILLFTISTYLSAQPLADSIKKKLESFLAPWNMENSPGSSVGIIKNDSLIFVQSVGMANLEYNARNTPTTNFNIGSMAKQFTAFGIFLLEKEKKLFLHEDVRKYLPWLPKFEYKITLSDLIYHTSGLRDYLILLQISGTRLEDIVTQEHVLKLISKQQRLNSIPGEKYAYSNSNYVLLAEVIQKVSGQKFRLFMDSAIFRPLGMTNSYFEDNYSSVHQQRSYSYERIDSTHFRNIPLNYSVVGAGGMYSNVTDLAKWTTNFGTNRVWDKKTLQKLTTTVSLKNGRTLISAAGLVVQPYMGWRQYYFSGMDGGYRSFQNYFPDLRTGVIILSNLTDNLYNNNFPYGSTNILIPKDTTHWELMPRTWADSASAKINNPREYMRFVGDFISDEGGYPLSFKLIEDKMNVIVNGQTNLMGRIQGDTFMTINSYQYRYVFNKSKTDTTITILAQDDSYTLRKLAKNPKSLNELQESFVGKYYCEELDCIYSISLKDGKLLLQNNKYDDVNLNIIGVDHLGTNNWWMNHLSFFRKDGSVTGFEVNTGRVMHLNFKKITSNAKQIFRD
ncbi:serine hydrolase domain-containing protein [Flavitalea sp.]|nr:serine hydrolase domain-containing protein [Flavitalea sp.]